MDRLEKRLSVVFVLILAISMTFASAASAELVYINDTSVDPGDSITVPILIDVTDSAGLGAATIELEYNSSVVEVTAVSDSDFNVFTPNIQNSSGYTRIVTYQSSQTGVGPGIIQFANITLQTVGVAGDSSTLDLSVITLSNNTGQPLSYAISNGTFTISDSTIPNISFDTERVNLTLHSTRTLNLTLNSAPTGISGYNISVSLSNGSVAEIISANFPGWATLNSNSSLPANSIWIKAADLTSQIESGANNVHLATLTMRGDSLGNTSVLLTVTSMDDDNGIRINSNIINTELEVIFLPPFPPVSIPPTDPDGDGLYEDTNGNGRIDFNDVIIFYNYLEWVPDNEPIASFDFNRNGRIDFNDIIRLYEKV